MLLPQFAFRRRSAAAAVAAAVVVAGACATGPAAIDRPRPLVVPSGERVQPDSVRLDSVNLWVQTVERVIVEDPTFFVDVTRVPRAAYPWETLEYRGQDTVRVAIQPGSDASLSYQIYGFLHLMKRRDRLGEWFPEAAALEGFDLERFILARTAESWLLGRAVFDTSPYPPLDELVYAQDRGYLDDMILIARPDEFGEVHEAWVRESPERRDEFETWFRETFDREPPGVSDP